MYKIKVISYFSGAHSLRHYKGKCESLHGHNWKVEARVLAAKTNKTGMIMDFGDLKTKLNAILETLDHKYLNDIPYFKKENPSSETIAKYIYINLKKTINNTNLRMGPVTVWETEGSCSAYWE